MIQNEVRRGLQAKLAALPGLTGVPVVSWLDPDRAEREYVAFGAQVRSRRSAPAPGGAVQHRHYSWTLDVWIVTQIPGVTADEAADRCAALMDVVDDWFAANWFVDAAASWASQLTEGEIVDPQFGPECEQVEMAAGLVWRAYGMFTIRFEAHT